ncbi:MAG: hypothetical protein HQM10_11270 [Candidatus Riflebacteria bacterium]|nr:hypothetical protein [Candidatus Riflebacteria bacterium]
MAEAIRCLEEAEKQAASVEDWEKIISKWIFDFSDAGRANKAREKAVRSPRSPEDRENLDFMLLLYFPVKRPPALARTARAKEDFNHPGTPSQVPDIRARMDAIVKNPFTRGLIREGTTQDLITVAEFDNQDGDPIKARDRLELAEAMATLTSDWLDCANSWIGLLQDHSCAENCMEKASQLADSSRDWIMCGNAWKHLFGQEEKTKKFFSKGLAVAQSTDDWIFCCDALIKTFMDTDGAGKAMEKAEAAAVTNSDALRCAVSWVLVFNAVDRAASCLTKAERLAQTPAHWKETAQHWEWLLQDEIAAGRCRKRAG